MTVAPGGTLIYGDLLAPGRTAHGEVLAYTRLRTRLVVRRPDWRMLYQEAASILPAHRSPLGRAILGDAPSALGTLVVVSEGVPPDALRDLVRDGLAGIAARAGVAVLPGGGGICVKVLGDGIAPVAATLRAAWAVARQSLLGVGLPAIRCTPYPSPGPSP